MIVNRYENGDIEVTAELEDFEGRESLMVYLVWALGDKDTYLFGEEYCVSNWEMAIDFYSAYTGLIYRFCYSLLEELRDGKTVRLYGREMTEGDQEEYKRTFGEG
jgi:hypothetical protein